MAKRTARTGDTAAKSQPNPPAKPKAKEDATASDKPVRKPREITPVHVITRVTGCGRNMAEAMVKRLGDDAAKLPALYEQDDVDGIHNLINPPAADDDTAEQS